MLIGHWPLNGNLKDYSGYENHAIENNLTFVDNGKIGKAGLFDGSSSFLNIENKPILNPDYITLTLWFNLNTVSGAHQFISKRTDYTTGAYWLYISGTNLIFDTMTASGRDRYELTLPIIAGEWYHLTAIYDGKIKAVHLNGELINSKACVYGPLTSSTSNINIGRDTFSEGYFMNGRSNDFRLYDHALSIKEIKNLARAKILHYKLDDKNIEATTNLAQNVFYEDRNYGVPYTATSWGGDAGTITYYENGGWNDLPYKKLIKTAGGTGGSYLDDNGPFEIKDNTTYAISVYMKADRNINGGPISIGINSGPANAYRSPSKGPDLTPEWQRFEWIYNSGDDHAGTQYRTRNIIYPDIDLPLEVYWCGFQIEEKDHTTPFVNGARLAGSINDCSGYGYHGVLSTSGELSIIDDPVMNIPVAKVTNMTITTDQIFHSAANQEWTLMSWAYIQGVVGEKRCYLNNFNRNNHFILTPTNNKAILYLNAGDDDSYSYSAGAIPIDEWFHITYVLNTKTLRCRIYLNGEEYGQAYNYTATDTPLGFSATTIFGDNVIGMLSDIRLYATDLTQDDIRDIYQKKVNLDDSGNIQVNKIVERENLIDIVNEQIDKKQLGNGLLAYDGQEHVTVTLTDDGYRIFRTPNINYPDGSTMWGGLRIDLSEIPDRKGILKKGHSYRFRCSVKGQSSNIFKTLKISNLMGWGGGGLLPSPIDITPHSNIPENFNGETEFIWEFTINDDIYKQCTSSYSSFVEGEIYLSYRDLQLGFSYENTGALGTDIYITNLQLYDITDIAESSFTKASILYFDQINEVTGTKNTAAQHEIDGTGILRINGRFSEVD